jgi:DNA-binding CsgD family transcriptional regulator
MFACSFVQQADVRQESYLQILDVLYDTAMERESWSNVIKAMAEPLGAATGHLLTWDKQSGLIPHYEVYSMDRSAMELYAGQWVLEDPRAAYFLHHPDRAIFSDDQIVSVREKRQRAFFSDWEHKLTDQRYVVGRRVHQSKSHEIIFSLGFDTPGGKEREPARQMFERLGSHLHRAVEIHQLFSRHLVKKSPEVQILDSLHFGVVFLDELGRPGFYNRVAEQISERADGLRLSSDGLKLRDEQSQSRFKAKVRDCQQQRAPGDDPAGGWISIARDGPAADYTALIIPMPEVEGLQFFSNPRMLVLISDPEQGRDEIGTALQTLFTLTDGEIQICLELAAGMDVSGIADKLSVSRETVRYHLKNIFSKTGVNRQGELIRLLLTLPTLPEPKA